MIIAYHAIFTTYGTWLPNDPRGSYSKEIYKDQLRALGRIKYGRQNPVPAKNLLIRFWTEATSRLTRTPFFIDDNIRPIIAAGFKQVVQRLDIKIPACAIMNDHVHVLILRLLISSKVAQHGLWDLNKPPGLVVVGRFLLQTLIHYWQRPIIFKPILPALASVLNPGISSPLYLFSSRRHDDFPNPYPFSRRRNDDSS